MKKKNIIKISAIVFSIILVIVAITTTTQSYFNKDNYAKNPTEYQTGLLSIEAVSKSNNISLSNTLPMSDTEGEQIEPYVFTIRNNGNVDYKFNIKLLSTSDNTFSPEYIKLKIDDDGIRTLASLTDSIIKEDVILPAGETIDITLRVWLSSDTKNTQIGKTFNSKIVIDGQSIYTSTNQEVQTYTIDYDANGGTETITSQNVVKGNKLTISNVTPTKSGYTFKGWSTSSTATTASYQPGETITVDKNTKLYAVWEAKNYNLTLNKGTGVSTIYYRYSTSGSRVFRSSASNITLKVPTGITIYYYGEPSTGYSITSCTESAPCSVAIGTSDITKTITATKSSSSSSYTVTIKRIVGVKTTQLTSATVAEGKSFSYDFATIVTQSSTTYKYSSVSCTNGQTPVISNSSVSLTSTKKNIKINNVTANTICTLRFTAKSSGGGTVTS